MSDLTQREGSARRPRPTRWRGLFPAVAILSVACSGERVRGAALDGDWDVLVWEGEALPSMVTWSLDTNPHGIFYDAQATLSGDNLTVLYTVQSDYAAEPETDTVQFDGTVTRRRADRLEFRVQEQGAAQAFALNCTLQEADLLVCVHPSFGYRVLSVFSRGAE